MRRMLFALVAVMALLSGVVRAADAPPPIKVLLICGGCCHDYGKQKDILKTGLEARAHCDVTIVFDPDKGTKAKIPIYNNPEWYKGYDVILHDECFADVKEVEFVEGILKPHKEGIPAVNLHCAMHCYRTGTDIWFKFLGLQSSSHGPQLPIELNFIDKEHPITKGMENWTTINEELYNNLKVFETAKPLVMGRQDSATFSFTTPRELTVTKDTGAAVEGTWAATVNNINEKDGIADLKTAEFVVNSKIAGLKELALKKGDKVQVKGAAPKKGVDIAQKKGTELVVAWTNIAYEKARVFSTTLGHNNGTVADPRYLDLVTRGLLWSCDKLNDTYLKKPAAK